MPRSLRLTLLLIPMCLSVLVQALPGRAQQSSVRFAFADTTLLRDTLGLSFARLFPVADSLQMTPDTVRALMVRYRLTMPRLLHLSDSLTVPVDSVGAFMERQKLNPLANAGAARRTDFQYTSGYDIQRTSSTWTNGSTYRMSKGKSYLNNLTNIELQRITSGSQLSLRQNREATTEAGLAVSNRLSFGARSYQMRFFSADPGSPVSQDETKNEYGLTARAQKGGSKLNTEVNLRSGYLDDRNSTAIKRGASGSADGRIRYNVPGLLQQDLSGTLTGNVSRTRPPTYPIDMRTHDLSSNLHGTLVLFPNSNGRVNLNYGARRTLVQNATDSTHINSIKSNNNSLDGTVRLRSDNDHYLDLNASTSRTGSATGQTTSKGGKATLRWSLAGWSVDANYNDDRTLAVHTRQRGGGGYDEHDASRSAEAVFLHSFGAAMIAKLQTNIGLDRYRYQATADSATPPTPRDTYRQIYRSELLYNPSQKLSSGVALQVSLNRTINIRAATTGSNSDTWSYRGEWRWSYRVLRSMTVNQSNQVQADYQNYPFAPTRNSLSLSYNNTTALSTVFPGGLSIDLQHTASRNPRGNYTLQSDGGNALLLSDDALNYILSASLRYAPVTAIALHVDPRYTSADRSGTTNGVMGRQRIDQRLDFSGGVDVNWKVGRTGNLTGRIGRTFTDTRTTNYSNGLPQPSPSSLNDYWNGNLQLTWNL